MNLIVKFSYSITITIDSFVRLSLLMITVVFYIVVKVMFCTLIVRFIFVLIQSLILLFLPISSRDRSFSILIVHLSPLSVMSISYSFLLLNCTVTITYCTSFSMSILIITFTLIISLPLLIASLSTTIYSLYQHIVSRSTPTIIYI